MVVDANWYSCNVKVISRSGVRTAVGAAAYITGTCLYDNERKASPNYEPSDYRRKSGVEQWFITAPSPAPEWTYDINTLVNEAQARDTRKNSCTARTGRFSLPSGADAAGRESIAHEFADFLTERYGVAVIVGIHAPDKHGDDRNWHMHFWFTTRQVDENGLGSKTRVLDDKKTGPQEIIRIREAVADVINDYLEETGIDERVDHRSHKDRGIDRTPMIHMGEAASALERKGIRTERGDTNRAIRESNRRREQRTQEIAALHAEVTREMENEFTEPELKTPLDMEDPQWKQEGAEDGRKEREWEPEVQVEALAGPTSAFTSPIVQAYREYGAETPEPQQAAPETRDAAPLDSSSAFTSPITRAYRAYVETPEEEQERAERRWYEELYNKTVATAQHYWGKFVDRIISWQQERDRDIEGPER